MPESGAAIRLRRGGFLARVAADGVQIFLETHSDHVLNGIRVAVADGSAALPSEQVVVYFFHDGRRRDRDLEDVRRRD